MKFYSSHPVIKKNPTSSYQKVMQKKHGKKRQGFNVAIQVSYSLGYQYLVMKIVSQSLSNLNALSLSLLNNVQRYKILLKVLTEICSQSNFNRFVICQGNAFLSDLRN